MVRESATASGKEAKYCETQPFGMLTIQLRLGSQQLHAADDAKARAKQTTKHTNDFVFRSNAPGQLATKTWRASANNGNVRRVKLTKLQHRAPSTTPRADGTDANKHASKHNKNTTKISKTKKKKKKKKKNLHVVVVAGHRRRRFEAARNDAATSTGGQSASRQVKCEQLGGNRANRNWPVAQTKSKLTA